MAQRESPHRKLEKSQSLCRGAARIPLDATRAHGIGVLSAYTFRAEGRRYRVRSWFETNDGAETEQWPERVVRDAVSEPSSARAIALALESLRGYREGPVSAGELAEDALRAIHAGLLRLEIDPALVFVWTPVTERTERRSSTPVPMRGEELTWIEVEVIGEFGILVPNATVTLNLSDGGTRVDVIGPGERVRVDGIPKGACHFSLTTPVDLEPPPALVAIDYDILVPHDRSATLALPTARSHVIAVTAPRALIVELTDAGFETAGRLMRPDAREVTVAEGPATSGLCSVAAALKRAFDDPELRMWVVGHADTVGDDDDNLALSLDRALNVQLFLSGKQQAWASHCQAYYTVGDFEAAYRFVAKTFGWDCDPGTVDDDFDDASRDARDRFRVLYAELTGIELARHVKQNEADWCAIFDMYQRALAAILGMTQEALAAEQDALRFVEPCYEGCGERFPKQAPGQDGFESLANRRVDIVLVHERDVRYLSSPPDAERIYGSAHLFRRTHVYVPGASDSLGEYVSQLVDEDGHPVPHERYELELPGGGVIEGRGDAEGFVRVSGVPIGVCRIVYPDIDAREWEAEVIGPRLLPPMPPPSDDEEED